MLRINEAELNGICARAAGEYIETRFKDGAQFEKHVVLNSYAHGYFSGARFCEEISNWSKTMRLWNHYIQGKILGQPKLHGTPWPDEWIKFHAPRAAAKYIRARSYQNLSWTEQALIRASFCLGFETGFEWRSDPSALKVGFPGR